MTMVGGFDVHRQQITFDYVDDDGLVRWGQIRPATRKMLRAGWASTAPRVTGSSRWRAAPGGGMWGRSWPPRVWWRIWAIRPRSRGCAGRRSGPRPTAPMRGCCARCCWRAGSRSRGSRRRRWWRSARLGRLYCALMEERRGWQQRIHAQLFHQGCPRSERCCPRPGREALASAELSAAGRQYVDTALRRIDELSDEIDPLRTAIGELRPSPARVSGAAGATTGSAGCARRSSGPRSGMRAGSPAPISWCVSPASTSPSTPRTANARRGICRGRAHRSCGGPPSRRPSARPGRGSPDYAYYHKLAAKRDGHNGKTRRWRWSARSCVAAITRCASSAMPPWRARPRTEVAA